MNLWLEYSLLAWYAVVIINAFFWLLSWPASRRKDGLPTKQEGVSVIICTRNTGDRLSTQILSWLQQEYPRWELIILDDHSTDNSWKILQKWKQEPRVRIFSMEEEGIPPGKKYAQRFGVSKAIFDWVLVTDADCRPASVYWIKRMMQARKKDTPVVLGVGL